MTHGSAEQQRNASPTVEMVYDATCPNVDHCRAALRAALAQAGLEPTWAEWDRNDPRTPASYRHYGSPTVLVDSTDVGGSAGSAPPSGNSCRIYADDTLGTLSGVPPVGAIVRRLTERVRTSSAAPSQGTA